MNPSPPTLVLLCFSGKVSTSCCLVPVMGTEELELHWWGGAICPHRGQWHSFTLTTSSVVEGGAAHKKGHRYKLQGLYKLERSPVRVGD